MMRPLFIALFGMLVVFFVVLAGCADEEHSEEPEEPLAFATLDEYYASIDYSCTKDEDCAIKDVHNCCGFYPQCVNSEAMVFLEFVEQQCTEEKMASICGFPSISSCRCTNQRCEGYEGQ